MHGLASQASGRVSTGKRNLLMICSIWQPWFMLSIDGFGQAIVGLITVSSILDCNRRGRIQQF